MQIVIAGKDPTDLEEYLQDAGHTVKCFYVNDICLNIAKAYNPDVFIYMEDVNEQIKHEDAIKQIQEYRILMVTQKSNPIIPYAAALGVKDFVFLPTDLSTILHRIENPATNNDAAEMLKKEIGASAALNKNTSKSNSSKPIDEPIIEKSNNYNDNIQVQHRVKPVKPVKPVILREKIIDREKTEKLIMDITGQVKSWMPSLKIPKIKIKIKIPKIKMTQKPEKNPEKSQVVHPEIRARTKSPNSKLSKGRLANLVGSDAPTQDNISIIDVLMLPLILIMVLSFIVVAFLVAYKIIIRS